MLPNIRILLFTPPFPVDAVVARHAFKDVAWTLRSGAGEETDEPVTVHVDEPLAAAPVGQTELAAENAALRLLLADSATKHAVALAAADTANADVDQSKKEAVAVAAERATTQALLAKQAAQIAQLEAQAKADSRSKAK